MAESNRFYFDGLVLSLHLPSYLVEIQRLYWEPSYKNKISDLPEWVFNSRLAIWITDESGSIHERALEGERIRKSFIQQRKLEKAG